ncbi:MAG: hypothetical protein ACTSVI_08350 [Promethearchaeota archaeon]
MVSLKEKMENRKKAKEVIGKRLPVSRILLILSISIALTFLGALDLLLQARLLSYVFLVLGIVLLILFMVLTSKYLKHKTEEQRKKKISAKKLVGLLSVVILFTAILVYSLSLLTDLMKIVPTGTQLHGRLVVTLIFSVVFFFGSIPFIMGLWYKTSPNTAVKLIIKLFTLFNRRKKNRISEIIVTEIYQETSLWVTFKRAINGMIFTMFMIFSVAIPLFSFISRQPFTLEVPEGIQPMIIYISFFFMVMFIPFVITPIIFSWALPPAWLLDDVGVVFFKKNVKKRIPLQIQSVSSWFLSFVKGLVGTSALYTYFYYVLRNIDNLAVIYALTSNEMVVIKSAMLFLGLPFSGSILMFFILILFQETQFNKLKTFVYQELINNNIDPRIVDISLERKDQFQERTLIDYYGENFFHNPPLRESVLRVQELGPLTLEYLLSKSGKDKKSKKDKKE